MKTETTASSHPVTTPPAADAKLQALLAERGVREFSFELRYSGKIVRGESYAWDWAEVDKPDEREMKAYIMEQLAREGVIHDDRRAWHCAPFSFKPGPLVTEGRFFELRNRQWEVKEAA